MIRDRKGAHWATPEKLVVIILAILLGLAFLYYIWQLRGKLMP